MQAAAAMVQDNTATEPLLAAGGADDCETGA
jgi:hypothetical protein